MVREPPTVAADEVSAATYCIWFSRAGQLALTNLERELWGRLLPLPLDWANDGFSGDTSAHLNDQDWGVTRPPAVYGCGLVHGAVRPLEAVEPVGDLKPALDARGITNLRTRFHPIVDDLWRALAMLLLKHESFGQALPL
jgi:hypothetical protein